MPRDNDEPYSIPESRGVSFPIYLATPSGKPLKIKNANDLKEEYTKVDKKYTELFKQKALTPEQQRKLVLLRDDREFLSQKLSEIEFLTQKLRGIERNKPAFGNFFGIPTERQEAARDTRLAFPLSIKTPSGNRYEFESFEDLDRLENKEALEQEFNARLGSTYNRKSREQIARELDSDLTAIRQKKREVLDKGYYYAKPQKLYYPTGEEIPTLEEGVTEKTAGLPIAQEIIRLGKNIKENSEAYNTLLEKGNSALEKGEIEEAQQYLDQARNLIKQVEQDNEKKKYLETLGGEYSKYTLTPHNIEKRKQQFAEKLGVDKPITYEDIAFIPAPYPEEATEIPQASSSAQNPATEGKGNQYVVDEAGNVIDVGRNVPIDQEKVRLAKIQEEASRLANLPFEENRYAKIAPLDIYEEVGLKNLSKLASDELTGKSFPLKWESERGNVTFNSLAQFENYIKDLKEQINEASDPAVKQILKKEIDDAKAFFEGENVSKTEPKSIFPFEVILPEDIKAANRRFVIKDQADLERVIHKTEQKIKEYKEKNLLGNAENFQKALDIIKGTYQSLKVQSESPEATAIREQNIRSQKGGFEYPQTEHLEAAEKYIHPRETFERSKYRDAMERYMNPDWLRSDYKTFKDELIGNLREKAMRRFEESVQDLDLGYKAHKMGRTGFYDQQKSKMFENMMRDLNTQDKELSLQLYGLNEQNAAQRAREAREGLAMSELQGGNRANVAMKMEEMERQKALEAYKINKLEEEAKLQRQRQAASDLITAGRMKRDLAQQNLNVQSAEFMRRQNEPKEKLGTYLDTLKKASIGQPPINMPERETFYEQRMLPRMEPPKAERELGAGGSTAFAQPPAEQPSTAFKDALGLGLAGANFWLDYKKYQDQQKLAEAASRGATGAPPAAAAAPVAKTT